MDEQYLDDLYDNLEDLDDEEDYDLEEDDDDPDPDEQELDEDAVAEVEDDEDEETTIEVITTNDEGEVVYVTEESPEAIDYSVTTPIEAATTGQELFDAVADVLENLGVGAIEGGHVCKVQFVTSSQFDELPDEEKTSGYSDSSYEPIDDDAAVDVDVSSVVRRPTVYFITDAY